MTEAILGQTLAVLSATAFASGNIYIARTTVSGGDKGVMFSVLVTCVISGLLWAGLEGGRVSWPDGAEDWRALGAFALAGFFAMVLGRTLVYESIRRLGAVRSSAVKRLNPFFSVLFAAILLNEAVGASDIAGMISIAAAFILLIRESQRRRGDRDGAAPPTGAYLFGLFSAAAYAMAYVARKSGLETVPAPAFGTFVSAAAGFACFAALALFSGRHRANFTGMFAHLDRYVVLAAVMVSVGQILMFAALAHARVTTVVMIASLEIFISMVLSVMVFRSERMPGPAVFLAAALAAAGVVLVSSGG